MIKIGILKPDDRVELLEGWIVKRNPQNPPHSNSVTRAIRQLARTENRDLQQTTRRQILEASRIRRDEKRAVGPRRRKDHGYPRCRVDR
jgi:hypothetical protein